MKMWKQWRRSLTYHHFFQYMIHTVINSHPQKEEKVLIIKLNILFTNHHRSIQTPSQPPVQMKANVKLREHKSTSHLWE